jgi:integrase
MAAITGKIKQPECVRNPKGAVSMMRMRYQLGSLTREARKAGPAVWIYRWREGDVHRKTVVGDVKEYTTKAAAMKACELLRRNVNRETRTPRTVGELVDHYRSKEMSDTSTKSFSTKTAYECYLRNQIVPVWGKYSLSDVRPVAVEDWLRSLSLANGTKAKIRNLLHVIFTHAMRHEWQSHNPISLVRQSTKRESTPDVLTVEELVALLAKLKDPWRTAVFVAAVTGLRASELFALKWTDCNFDDGELHVTRAVVCQHVGATKTEASAKPVPMSAGLARVLQNWRSECPFNQDRDFIFGSPEMDGQQPYWSGVAMQRHVRPAAQRAGISKRIGWHTFRHSFGTLVKSNGADVKTTQELMRHATAVLTLDRYVQAVTPAKLAAQEQIVEQLFPFVPTQAGAAVIN